MCIPEAHSNLVLYPKPSNSCSYSTLYSFFFILSDPPINKNGLMVFNATFNNISVILWLSVLLVEEIGVPGKNHRSIKKNPTESKDESEVLCYSSEPHLGYENLIWKFEHRELPAWFWCVNFNYMRLNYVICYKNQISY